MVWTSLASSETKRYFRFYNYHFLISFEALFLPICAQKAKPMKNKSLIRK